MEYVFLIAFVISVWIYMSDRKFWNATAKRISTNIRANLEAGQPIPTLEPVKEKDAWEQQFKAIENPPSAALVPVAAKLRHEIVSHDYELALGRLWPRAKCKCGFKVSTPDGIYSEKETLRKTREKAETHVRIMNKADELKANGSKYQW